MPRKLEIQTPSVALIGLSKGLRNIGDEIAAADVFRQKKTIDRPMPERRLENRPKEPVVATDDRSEALFAPNVLGNAPHKCDIDQAVMGLDGVSTKIKAIRPPVMARSTAARMFASSNPSVKPTPFVQRHPSNGRSLFAASCHCVRGSRLGVGSLGRSAE
jgi:hypothetical protein